MIYTRLILSVLLSLITISLMGCCSPRKDIEAFQRPDKVDVTAESYVLQPPDEIEIHCSRVPEIHLQRQQIRPDGKVSFETLGEIEAAGKTPEQLADTLRLKVLDLYALTGDKPIDVRIVAYRSKMFYVLGEVYLPGPRICTGRDSVLTALAYAKLTPMAWPGQVKVIRPSNDKSKRPKIFKVNYNRMVAHGDTRKNVLLQEGDIIYVPPTVLAAVGLKVEEIIRPVARAFSGIYIVQNPPYSGGDYGGGYR